MSAPSPTPTPLQIGLVLFPRVTQLDFTGPLQVFSSLPGAKVHLIWKRIEPVPSDSVLVLTPTTTFADCPQLDVVCVPGGFGINALMADEATLAFVRRQAEGARFVTSVCTGALVYAAAGLLSHRPATTHWAAFDELRALDPTVELREHDRWVDDVPCFERYRDGQRVGEQLHNRRRCILSLPGQRYWLVGANFQCSLHDH